LTTGNEWLAGIFLMNNGKWFGFFIKESHIIRCVEFLFVSRPKTPINGADLQHISLGK